MIITVQEFIDMLNSLSEEDKKKEIEYIDFSWSRKEDITISSEGNMVVIY